MKEKPGAPRVVALLRGINVGGNNLIKMADLVSCLEDEGFDDVETYIASGNVVFGSSGKDSEKLTRQVEKALEKRFGMPLRVVVRTHAEMRETVKKAPRGFGKDPKRYRYDVIFLKEPLTAKAAMKDVPVNEAVDEVTAGPGALYYSRLVAKATQSRLNRVVALPIYKQMTIRNWNTTTRLLALMDREDE